MKNKTIKMMFTEKINKQQIYNNVLNYQEKKKNSLLMPTVTISIVIIGTIFILINHSSKSSNLTLTPNKSYIKINEVIDEPCANCSMLKKDNLYTSELSPTTENANSNIEFSHEIEIPSEIKNLMIPEDLKLTNYFVANLEDNDNLDENKEKKIHELIYQSSSTKKKIKITYSKNNVVTEKYKIINISDSSLINDTILYIYNLDNLYRAIFTYKNNYYRVESVDIKEEEFITLLESIIKE